MRRIADALAVMSTSQTDGRMSRGYEVLPRENAGRDRGACGDPVATPRNFSPA
jgi:hypothetical protein